MELQSLLSGQEKEEWFSLTGVTPIGEWGSLRLKLRYLHDLIMPEEEYSPLKDLVLDSKLEVVRALADICHSDRTPLASALLRIFRSVLRFKSPSSRKTELCVNLLTSFV